LGHGDTDKEGWARTKSATKSGGRGEGLPGDKWWGPVFFHMEIKKEGGDVGMEIQRAGGEEKKQEQERTTGAPTPGSENT